MLVVDTNERIKSLLCLSVWSTLCYTLQYSLLNRQKRTTLQNLPCNHNMLNFINNGYNLSGTLEFA